VGSLTPEEKVSDIQSSFPAVAKELGVRSFLFGMTDAEIGNQFPVIWNL
jgi:hypothetical protein